MTKRTVGPQDPDDDASDFVTDNLIIKGYEGGKAKKLSPEEKVWAAIDAVRNSPHGGSEIADALEAVYGKARP